VDGKLDMANDVYLPFFMHPSLLLVSLPKGSHTILKDSLLCPFRKGVYTSEKGCLQRSPNQVNMCFAGRAAIQEEGEDYCPNRLGGFQPEGSVQSL